MFQNRMLLLIVALTAWSCLLLPSTGCNSEPKLDLVKTTGTVTIDGEPLTIGEVAFIPDSGKGTSGPVGAGVLNEKGEFEIRTAGQPGALAGWHQIRITAIDESKPDKPWIIPIKYRNPMKSGLGCQVKAGEENKVVLELSSTE
jgi:hypothetical protein